MFYPASSESESVKDGAFGMPYRPSQRTETASVWRLKQRGYQEWCEANMPAQGDCDSGKTAVVYLDERKREKA